ncbi:unnamed protein product [Owenia fusiformis]|uniref:Uncharacterized protein n=1 Tax=Owenia fusiformis TaxID=6347 RepID=A0A8J1UV91_OWEFU|nr:unnamed protein product [Owenia fusiformis]
MASNTQETQESKSGENDNVSNKSNNFDSIAISVDDTKDSSDDVTDTSSMLRKKKQRPKSESVLGDNRVNKQSTLKRASDGNCDEDALNESLDSARRRIVTMTGTITRGNQIGQTVDVELKLSQDELRKLNQSFDSEDDDPNPDCVWGPKKGLHIFLFTLLVIPVALVLSFCVAFYMGIMMWYNMFIYFSEERTIWHKIFICPLLILFLPFLIVLVSLGIGLYACIIQISWWFRSWKREIRDYEKGFYGWICNKLDIAECSPYEVVILDESQLDLQTPLQQTEATAQSAV